MRRPNYYNSEGYPSPTEYYAELHIMQEEQAKKAALYGYRPMVFICSPYSGDIKANIKKARRYCRLAVKKGYLPIAPHLLFPQFLDDNNEFERELGMSMGLRLQRKCKEVWVFGEISSGMRIEIKKARWRGLPIRYFNEKGREERNDKSI